VSAAAKDQPALETLAPANGRRERNKLEKRARIVQAARDLFESQGFANTTTQQIAEEADIGTGTLFLYAGSKEDLLILVFQEEMKQQVAEIFATLPANANVVGQLSIVFEKMFEYHGRDIGLSRVLLKELIMPSSPERRGDIGALMDIIYDGLQNIIVRYACKPECDPYLVARSAFALYYFALINWVGGGLKREDCFASLVDQLRAFFLTEVSE
jgi:TetR/AcrR family transcriptional regulator, cholesterol catabolism regulator